VRKKMLPRRSVEAKKPRRCFYGERRFVEDVYDDNEVQMKDVFSCFYEDEHVLRR